MKTMILNVPGMTCDNCARSVESALHTLRGVKEAAADLASGTVRVRMDEHSSRTAELLDAIQRIGFQVDGFQASE